jgi:glycosyltransferase involved in cell wall biosynthesis
MLRIGIDARANHFPGIGRYIREIIHHLSDLDATNRYMVYFSNPADVATFPYNNGNFKPVLVKSDIYTVAEQFKLTRRLNMDRLDIFHSPTSLNVPLLKPCRHVVTVHDLLLKVMPSHLPSALSWVYYNLMNIRTIRYADRIITVSNFTARELTARYPGAADKIDVVQHGIGRAFSPTRDQHLKDAVLKRHGMPEKYLLYVGTRKKHKNLGNLLLAYSTVPEQLRDEYPLVLVGKRDPRCTDVQKIIDEKSLRRNVLEVGFVEEENLPYIYAGATLFIFLSIYEGFGFPLLESMACGTPVVASRIPPFVEVAGDAAVFVDPLDPPSVGNAIVSLLEDSVMRENLSKEGEIRAKDFTWNRAAERILDIYRSVCTTV